MREATDPKKAKLYKNELKETRKEIIKVKGEIKKMGNQGAAAMSKLNKQASLGRQLFLRLKSVMLTVFGAYALIQGIRNTVSAIAKFEVGMARVGAITNATNEELKKLTNTALLAASSGIFSPAKLAEVEVVLAKLGFTVTEIGDSLEHMANLALATGEDLVTSANLVATTLRELGLEASQTRHIVDVLGKSFTTSALDVGKYSESIKYLAPIARNMRWSLEDLTSILGVLADNMISGSLAGTGVRQMLIELADSSSDANKVLGRQVRTFEDFLEFLDKLKESGAGLNEAVNLFNKRSATAVVSLIENADRLREYRGEMDSTSGAIKEMADRIRGELIPTVDNLNASWQAWLNSTAGTGGLADGLNNIKGAIDAVTLANIHQIRTWNTLGQILSRYKEEWLSFFSGEGFDFLGIFRNEGFDLLQTQLKSLDENIVLLTSDFGKFFDTVGADARAFASLQERALFSVGKYNAKLAEVYTTIGERQLELTTNIERQRIIIAELMAGGLSNDQKSALLNELDELKIRTIELETLIGFYKGIKKELSDNVFKSLKDVDINILKDTFDRLNETYKGFSLDVKNSPTGEYFRNVLKLYQEAIFDLKNKGEDILDEWSDEEITAYRNSLKLREQYELAIANLLEDGAEKERIIAEIKHRYQQQYYDLDIKLARGNAEEVQDIHNLMAADVKTYLKTLEDINKKYSEKEIEEARKKFKELQALEKARFDVSLQLAKNAGKTKEELAKKELEFDIRQQKNYIAFLESIGAEKTEIALAREELAKLNAELAAPDVKDEVEKNIQTIVNAYRQLANEVIDSIQLIVDSQVAATERIVDDLDTRVSETQRELEIEAGLYRDGYANNVTLKKKELAELKAARDKAIKDREAAIRKQQAIEAVAQAINLGSAVAKTINTYASIPFVGVALALAAVGSFLGLFFAAQNKIKSATQYGEGGRVDGKSHAQGGVPAELEGGEYVIKKSAYAKHAGLIHAINSDTLPTLNQSVLNSTSFEKKGDVVVSTKEWGEIRDLLADNLKGERVVIQGNKKIITSGIKKRIINNV